MIGVRMGGGRGKYCSACSISLFSSTAQWSWRAWMKSNFWGNTQSSPASSIMNCRLGGTLGVGQLFDSVWMGMGIVQSWLDGT